MAFFFFFPSSKFWVSFTFWGLSFLHSLPLWSALVAICHPQSLASFFFPSPSSFFLLLAGCKFGWLVMTQLWILATSYLQLFLCTRPFFSTHLHSTCVLFSWVCYPFPEYMQRKGERGMVHKVYKVKFSIVESEVQLLTCGAFGPSTPALALLPVHHLGWTVYKEETGFHCVPIP